VRISKNFVQSEFECRCKPCIESNHSTFVIDNLLVEKLQEVRDELNQAVVINSGFRCTPHNETVGGIINSAHLTGKAADITIPNDTYRKQILRILDSKFLRIGIYTSFIHVDVDQYKPQNVTFVD